MLRDQLDHMTQHGGAADPFPAWITDAEHVTDVAQPGRRQHGITQRMRGDVPVGMPGAAVGAREQQPHQPAWSSGLDRVNVNTQAHSG